MLESIIALLWNRHTRSLALFLMRFLPIRKNRIIAVSWGGATYNCNPRAIVEALIANSADAEIYYAFEDPERMTEVPASIKKVQLGSLEYYMMLATSHIIICNIRWAGYRFPYKKKDQIYIQTMHGGHGIKRVEFDVASSLNADYLKWAKLDTQWTDLMLSDSDYWTHVYRTAYYYEGEVLEKGLPRNDVFFSTPSFQSALRQSVAAEIGVPVDAKYLIYTPTFRNNGRRDVYGFDVDCVVTALESRFGGTWYILVSSHPNMRDYYKEIYDFSHPRMVDVGMYPELQDLLVISDALITDYSSAEMDYSLTHRPVFQLIRDAKDYDRGTYLDPKTLPFPYAEDDETLCQNIRNFDDEAYQAALNRFNSEVIGLKETGHAAEAVAKWIEERIN